jgi:hypothetical protein
MTPDGARSLALAATASAGVLTTGARIVRGDGFSFKVVAGAGIAAVVMTGLASGAPNLVGGVAGLLLVTSLMTGGAVLAGPLVKYLTGKDVHA